MAQVNVTIEGAPQQKEEFVRVGTVAEFIKSIAKTDDINSFTEVLDKTVHFAKTPEAEKFCFRSYCFLDGPKKPLPVSKVRPIGKREIWGQADDGQGITKSNMLEVFQYQGKSWVKASDYEATIFQ